MGSLFRLGEYAANCIINASVSLTQSFRASISVIGQFFRLFAYEWLAACIVDENNEDADDNLVGVLGATWMLSGDHEDIDDAANGAGD